MSVLYLDHFNLNTDPFRITPDTDFFFSGGQRGDILEGLVVASMHDEGIVCVVGEIGMGKTMLSRMLLDRLQQLPADTVYLANPVFDRDEILGAIARDLMPNPPCGNRTQTLAALESVLINLYSQDRRVVVVVDEAHSMPGATLEEIRLLSNLETSQHKLLKIVLFGQPELDGLLDAPHLRQVKDRISHRFELQPLSAAEALAYLMFRLHKAGWSGGELFDAKALAMLVQASEGRTRKINMLADKSMLAAYANGVPQVGLDQVRRAVGDSLPGKKTVLNTPAACPAAQIKTSTNYALPAAITFGVLAAAFAGYGLGRTNGNSTDAMAKIGASPSASLLIRNPASTASSTKTDVRLASPAEEVKSLASLSVNAKAIAPLVVATAPLPTVVVPAALGAGPPVFPTPAASALASSQFQLSGNSTYVAREKAANIFIALASTTGFTVQLLSQASPHEEDVLAVGQLLQTALVAAALPDVPVLMHDRIYKNQRFHALYVGHFPTRAAATQFVESAPPEFNRYKPVIRSFDAIRKEPAP